MESDKVISGLIGDINFKTVTFKDFAKNFDDPRVKQLEKELQVAKQATADVAKEKEKELENELKRLGYIN